MQKAAERIVAKLRCHGYEAYFAGGWVRDSLLNRKPKDIDIATSAHPQEVRRLFPHSTGIGIRFGVVQVRMYGRAYEVTTFRSDAPYLDGRRPSSVLFSGLQQDALRRDFTINGMFYNPLTDRLIDYVNGRSDIKTKRIRTIGDPRKRFGEDKLRMLRAIRFACNLGFRITPATWKALQDLAPTILQVSWERIRNELFQILTGPAPGLGFKLLHTSGLLLHILPESNAPHAGRSRSITPAREFAHTEAALNMLRHPSSTLAFGTLLYTLCNSPFSKKTNRIGRHELSQSAGDKTKKICRRLRLSREETERISDLLRSQSLFPNVQKMSESSLKRFLSAAYFHEHLELHRVATACLGIPLMYHKFCRQKLREYREEFKQNPLITGKDLIAAGYQPGPIFKRILRTIEDLQLEGTLTNRKEAMNFVEKMFPLANS